MCDIDNAHFDVRARSKYYLFTLCYRFILLCALTQAYIKSGGTTLRTM